MSARRGVGRTEVMVGVAVVAVLALITIPLWISSGNKTGREEVPLNVQAIKVAEIAYMKAFEEYVSADPAPRAPTAVNETSVPWVSNDGFDELAWEPKDSERVFGSYAVVAKDDSFIVTGTCDVDGNGKRAVFTATAVEDAKMTTDEKVF